MPETQTTETATAATAEAARTERKSSLFSDVLTIIGFAILFIIVLWGLVHLVSLVANSFSPNFLKPAATIQVNAPAQTTSGQQTAISWNYSPSVSGSYAFLYQCQSGLVFEMKSATSSGTAIPCGVAYTVAGANDSLAVTPVLSGASSATDTVSVVFIPSEAGARAQGDATMAVVAAAKPSPARSTPEQIAYAPTHANADYASPYSGPAALSVRIISGTINAYGDGTVSFDIANIGGSPSGSYYFTAQMPTAKPVPYQSPLQSPLAPGSHITNTLNFTDAAPGGGQFSVTIEGGSANSSSDYASMELTGPYSNGYNNYGYSEPYVQYPYYTY